VCHICGSVMKPEPESNDPPDPTSDPPSERFVDTEAWVDDWWREAGTGG